MNIRARIATFLALFLTLAACATEAQRPGTSARITIGTVVSAQQVDMNAQTGRNALLGGAAGWALARNQSSSRQGIAAAAGAGLGAAAGNARAGTGMQYSVRVADGSTISVVTDQREVRVGDCVSVEETGGTANIRRVDPALCQPASPAVTQQVTPMLQAEADRCEAAKERLFAATTSEEVAVARQVMDILCND